MGEKTFHENMTMRIIQSYLVIWCSRVGAFLFVRKPYKRGRFLEGKGDIYDIGQRSIPLIAVPFAFRVVFTFYRLKIQPGSLDFLIHPRTIFILPSPALPPIFHFLNPNENKSNSFYFTVGKSLKRHLVAIITHIVHNVD